MASKLITEFQTLSRLAADRSQVPAPKLTDRELEVLKLVAQGMTNRDVADQLYIAENTAANHVRSILRKTGSANRTRAARYAAERDLL